MDSAVWWAPEDNIDVGVGGTGFGAHAREGQWVARAFTGALVTLRQPDRLRDASDGQWGARAVTETSVTLEQQDRLRDAREGQWVVRASREASMILLPVRSSDVRAGHLVAR